MEATIQSTNRAINIDVNVSINVDVLKAIIQRGWKATWVAGKQYVLMPIKQRVLQAINEYLTLSKLWIGGWAIAYIYIIYMYA